VTAGQAPRTRLRSIARRPRSDWFAGAQRLRLEHLLPVDGASARGNHWEVHPDRPDGAGLPVLYGDDGGQRTPWYGIAIELTPGRRQYLSKCADHYEASGNAIVRPTPVRTNTDEACGIVAGRGSDRSAALRVPMLNDGGSSPLHELDRPSLALYKEWTQRRRAVVGLPLAHRGDSRGLTPRARQYDLCPEAGTAIRARIHPGADTTEIPVVSDRGRCRPLREPLQVIGSCLRFSTPADDGTMERDRGLYASTCSTPTLCLSSTRLVR